MPNRRADDDEERDYRSMRKYYPVVIQRLNGHAKWVIATMSSAVVAVAAWGILADRAAVEKRLSASEVERSELRQQLMGAMRDQYVAQAEQRQFRDEVLRRLNRIETNSEAVKRAVQ